VTRNEFERLVQPLVEELGFELVQMSVSRIRRRHQFRIFADKDGGLAVKDCAFLSRRVKQILDQDPLLAGNYTLEVSSPGMNRPIWTLAHYKRFNGERVRLSVREPRDGRRIWTGRIESVDGDDVTIDLDGTGAQRFGLDEIEEAHLDMDPWKRHQENREGNR